MKESSNALEENTKNCIYCHFPFYPAFSKVKDGYVEKVQGYQDEQGVYFRFLKDVQMEVGQVLD